VVGMPGKYTGRKVSEGVYDGQTLEGMVGLMNPQTVEPGDGQGARRCGTGAGQGRRERAQQHGDADRPAEGPQPRGEHQARRVRSPRRRARPTSCARSRRTSRPAPSAYQEEIAKVRSDLEASHSRTQASLASASANVENIAREKLAAEDKAAEEKKALEKEIEQDRIRMAGIAKREELRKAPHVADGRLLASQQGLRTAFIDLGRKDLLQAGTVFMVRSPALTTKDGPSASPVVKCKATVVRVLEDRSEVELSDFADEVGDFPRAGDLLFNDLYSPRVTRTIYLMGRFQAPYQKEPLKLLLTRLGNKVVDKMGPGVDTVILGNDPLNEEPATGLVRVQDSEEYKLADKLHVEFQTLQAVRDFLKL
jgi:hypothetical protein